MSQSRENLWTDRRMDRETLFYRTLLAKIGGPKIEKETKKGVVANQKQKKKNRATEFPLMRTGPQK